MGGNDGAHVKIPGTGLGDICATSEEGFVILRFLSQGLMGDGLTVIDQFIQQKSVRPSSIPAMPATLG